MARKSNLQDKQVKIKRFYKLRIGRLVVRTDWERVAGILYYNKANEKFMVEIDGFFSEEFTKKCIFRIYGEVENHGERWGTMIYFREIKEIENRLLKKFEIDFFIRDKDAFRFQRAVTFGKTGKLYSKEQTGEGLEGYIKMMECEFYLKNGRLKSKRYYLRKNMVFYDEEKREVYFIDGKFHREDGPAVIEYYEDGKIKEERYYFKGKKHRADGPAVIEYYENGRIRSEFYFFNGKRHRVDGPAVIEYDKNGKVLIESYWVAGKFHRADGPAGILYYKDGKVWEERYCFENKLHRADGPAYVKYYENGNIEREEYYVDGKRHRTDGPAYIEYYENGNIKYEGYYVNGNLHRVDGPAWIEYDENGSIKCEKYYINGGEYKSGDRALSQNITLK